MKIIGAFLASVAALFAFTILFGSWYTVDEGERGVILRNGAISGVATPGLGFKLPIADSVEKISVQTRVRTFEKLQVYSRDQQPADIRISVNYHLVDAAVKDVYSRFGGETGVVTRLIDPRVYEHAKTVFGGYTAVSAIQDRGKLNADIRKAITENIQGPVVIEGVQIENIDFSDAYEQSIEARMQAEVEVQKVRQNAEREMVTAQITVTKAKAEAERIKSIGDAEAAAIKARGDALKTSPELVALTAAEKWNGVLPQTMVPGGATPFVSVK